MDGPNKSKLVIYHSSGLRKQYIVQEPSPNPKRSRKPRKGCNRTWPAMLKRLAGFSFSHSHRRQQGLVKPFQQLRLWRLVRANRLHLGQAPVSGNWFSFVYTAISCLLCPIYLVRLAPTVVLRSTGVDQRGSISGHLALTSLAPIWFWPRYWSRAGALAFPRLVPWALPENPPKSPPSLAACRYLHEVPRT